jgi:hypothetical protein
MSRVGAEAVAPRLDCWMPILVCYGSVAACRNGRWTLQLDNMLCSLDRLRSAKS